MAGESPRPEVRRVSLRLRLVLAFCLVALVPMAIALALPLMQAARRAEREAHDRLERAVSQARALIAWQTGAAEQEIARAAWEFSQDREMQEVVLQGPDQPARGLVESLARRHGLDRLEIRDPAGTLLVSFVTERADRPVAVRGRRRVATSRERLTLDGTVVVGRDLLEAVAAVAASSTAFLAPDGRVVERAGREEGPDAPGLSLPVGGEGWQLRVSVSPADIAEVRRDALVGFLGIAPAALLGALAAGLLVAHGISRPVRRLTDWAEGIAAERAHPILLPQDEDEVRRLRDALERMVENLAESERQRLGAERIAAWQQVARRLAHEVKNPLSPIQLAAENLRRVRKRAPEQLPRSVEEETAVIVEEVEGLRRLVDEFSEFARMPSPRPEPLDPRVLVRRALSLARPRIEALGVELALDDRDAPPQLIGDGEQLGRALKNVLANALDALAPVATRRLDVLLRTHAASGVPLAEIVVRDTGVGLTAEAKRRAFEPYFTTRGPQGGTGLGMAIVARIVAEHRGTIAIDGSPGKGAVVTLRLPVEGRGEP